MNPIRVLIVDDSRMIRDVLTDILKEQPGIEVVGAAADAFEARDMIRDLKPDVVTLDVEMPRMNGLEFLDKLMRARPTPVVMISAFTERGSEVTFRALELGAVEFVTKPKLHEQTPDDYGTLIAEKIRAAKSARLRAPRRVETTLPTEAAVVQKRPVPRGIKTSDKLIAVGASTGGTEAIKEFLVGMPEDCPGIVIVQHMPENFTRMFAERLDGLCKIRVKEAEHNDPILPGHAYIAPGGKHLWVKRDEGALIAKLSNEPPMTLHRPAVDFLFMSCAKYVGKDCIGVIMTGMGKDGTRGMLEMRDAGAYNIAQDEATSVIFGMPREAIEAGAVHEVAPLTRLRDRALARLTSKERA
ncbi:protein-glutamate methylesterase/protein-glutamine glutaminase [Usitatibacter palustris]|uniref:Protein-glutamate methylesterase/protein-glutamine glutaminase n=1 Tax=Usitatibacter palustris TaxID=2732487 RepID=A0A6M4HAG4_9PROT|nr:chemotaxis response regulator protein-glutamate methylesterase [Usitatibacter palustris]QJR15037.1 Protein-glutamate methylesterase/protein-glutamine glutaminase [Usitatibacter palustris]